MIKPVLRSGATGGRVAGSHRHQRNNHSWGARGKTEKALVAASRDGKDQEVVAWRQIYNIDSRYLGFVKGRIEKWYKAYWQYLKTDDLPAMTEGDKKRSYFAALEADESELLNYIKRPALQEFLEKCDLAKAKRESEIYT